MAIDIIEVTEADFEYQVIAYSNQVPVVVDFWAAWCVPCRTLGPILEKLAMEAGGDFRLAKVDVDSNQGLANRYFIRSIPAVKVFKDGKVISEFMGALPEPRLREFIRSVAPGQTDLLLSKGNNQLAGEQWEAAESTFRQVLTLASNHPGASLGLARSLLALGQPTEASGILRNFPASREYSTAQTLLPLAQALTAYKTGPGYSNDPLEAAYLNSIRLIGRGNLAAAMDGLLDILRQDKRFGNGQARQVLLGVFAVLGEESQLTRQYRQELASVLF